MVRNYVRKTDRQTWTAGQLESAVRAINHGCSKTEAARCYGVPKKTLLRYLSRVEGSTIPRQLGSFTTIFNSSQEVELVNYIQEMCRTFYGLTATDVRSLAFQMAEANNIPHPFDRQERLAGRDWFYGFRKRYPNLVLRSAENTSMARAKGFNRTSVNDYFGLISKIFSEHLFPPSKFYNMDEFGVSPVPTKGSKVVATRGQRQVGGICSAEKGETTTVVLAMSAAGDFVPPMFIFGRQRMSEALKVGAPYGSTFACNPSGWSTIETCTKWFDSFLSHTRPTEEEPVLLLLDGHKSHTKNLQLLEKARRNHVRIVSIPPHTSHKLQPCDLTLMASVRSNYDTAVHGLLRQSPPGRVVTTYDICSLVGQAFRQSASRLTAENGFRRAGLVPLNPGLFTDDDFASADYLSRMNEPEAVEHIEDGPGEVGQLEPEEVPAVEEEFLNEYIEGDHGVERVGEDPGEVDQLEPEEVPVIEKEVLNERIEEDHGVERIEEDPGEVGQLAPEEVLGVYDDPNELSQIIVEANVFYVIEDGEVKLLSPDAVAVEQGHGNAGATNISEPFVSRVVNDLPAASRANSKEGVDQPGHGATEQVLPEFLDPSAGTVHQVGKKKCTYKRPASNNEKCSSENVPKKRVRWDASAKTSGTSPAGKFLIPPCDVVAQQRSENTNSKPKTRKRKPAKKEVASDLTSDDYYEKLLESTALKDIKNIQKTQRKRRSGPKKAKLDLDFNDILCADCGGQFSLSTNGDGWKKCSKCDEWYHDQCTNRSAGSCGFC